MKYLLIALVLVVVMLLIVRMFSRFFHRLGEPVNAALSDSYYHHARKKIIVYAPMGNWFELGYFESPANPASFQVLSNDYGKDDKTVFWRGRPQPVDHTTFRLDENNIPKDDFRVYYDQHYLEELLVVEGADPHTYHTYTLPSDRYNQGWHRDKHSIYATGKRMEVDAPTFQRLNETLALDTNHVYAIVSESPGLSPGAVRLIAKASHPGGAAEFISDNYARIGNTIAHANWIRDFSLVSFPSIDSVRVLDARHLAVNGILLADGQIVDGCDVNSFQPVGQRHIRDKERVYYLGSLINEAQASTFEEVSEDYAKDNRYAYYQGRVLAGANPATFRYESRTDMATDGTLRFKNGQVIK